MTNFEVIQSSKVSKEIYCFHYCSIKQRTVCIINVWGYTEILPTEVLLRSAVLQWMKERGIFVVFRYSYYVNYDDCGTAVVLSSEITLLRRGIYVKCQAFAPQRTGHSRRCHMT